MLQTNAYDEFGTPDTGNGGRFQFTGQQFVPELGLYYYKARMYSPLQGRFMQTDPIGYADGMNMYAYVGNDPVNFVDYWGLARWYRSGANICVDIEVFLKDPVTGEETPQFAGTRCWYDPLPEAGEFDPNIPTWLQPDDGGGPDRRPEPATCFSAREGGSSRTGSCQPDAQPPTRLEMCQELAEFIDDASFVSTSFTLIAPLFGGAEARTRRSTSMNGRALNTVSGVIFRSLGVTDVTAAAFGATALHDYNALGCESVL